MIDIYSDGSCKNIKGVPSSMGIGVVAYYKGFVIDSVARFVGFGTSNIAEWLAFIEAAKIAKTRAKHFDIKVVNFYLDSKVVVSQFNNVWRNNEFKAYQTEANKLLKGINIKVQWTARENNTVADDLSKVGNPKIIKSEL